ncbi:MAG: site-specific integrase [Lachnospiraceae bacterium]
MPKRGENIYRRKDGRWEGRYIKGRTPAGKAVYGYVYAYTYKEVRSRLQQRILQFADMQTTVCKGEKEQLYFYVLTEEWFRCIKPLTKESTYRKYKNLWNSYIRPELGDMQISEISLNVLNAYCRKLLVSGGYGGKGLSAKTVADTLSLIRGIFRFCAGREIPVPCDTKAVIVKQSAKEMRVFTLKEQQKICSYICRNPCPANLGILVSLFAGLRVGEVCALRWEDISLSEKTLYVHQTMQRLQTGAESGAKTRVVVTVPKSSCSIRTIPLPDGLVRILQSADVQAAGYFLTGSDTKWMEPRTMQNYFKRLLKNCSIEYTNYHTLRHTFATRCVEVGFDVKSLSEILGHASVQITMNRYVHPSMQLKRDHMQRLSDLIAVK